MPANIDALETKYILEQNIGKRVHESTGGRKDIKHS